MTLSITHAKVLDQAFLGDDGDPNTASPVDWNQDHVIANGTTGSGAIVLATSPTITTSLTLSNNAIGAVSSDGILLQNTTAAALGAQQWSPRLHFAGKGWETSTSASQTVEIIAELQTVQGTTNPSGNLVWSSQVNGGGYTAQMALSSGGQFAVGANGTNGPFPLSGVVALFAPSGQTINTAQDTSKPIVVWGQAPNGVAGSFLMDAFANCPAFVGRRAQGSAGSLSAVTQGTFLVAFEGQGYNGAAYPSTNQGAITVEADENWDSTHNATKIGFWGVPLGGSTTISKHTVAQGNGFWGYGTTTPQSLHHLNANTVLTVPAITGTMLQLSQVDGTAGNIQIDTFTNGSSLAFPQLIMRSADGTAGSLSALSSGRFIFILAGRGYDGSAYSANNAGAFSLKAGSLWTSSNHETTASINVVPNGSTSASSSFNFNSDGSFGIGTSTAGGSGALVINNATFMIRTKTTFTNGAAANTGTLTNAPAAGNPTKWIAVDDNGTTRQIPAW